MREERVKHGEGSGHAGGRNKGESEGGLVSSVGRKSQRARVWRPTGSGRWHNSIETTTIFVDNIPIGVTKRAFQRYGGAIRAVKRLNGVTWNGAKLFVTISKPNRGDVIREGNIPGTKPPKQRWVKVRKTRQNDGTGVGMVTEGKEGAARKKEIRVQWSEEQRHMLNRSLLGVCVKPIEFRKIMNHLLDNWTGEGEIECWDVGPYRCLLTFSSSEILHSAMRDELLLSVFDEVRHHWGIFSTLSRRVWVEVTGIPIGLWHTDTFNKLANLWGKLIQIDD
ncbi:hypothetical protein PIB30_017492 [Stylosanthes scabra]|uniref:DUF4283 domain-containing protein n=1 Tax=Stylosanthes scabra TaxID=79078 RepID=A0ABU6Q7G5_9FABA|nr:hypothetical protein [Stylosanthes scabra]